MESDLSSQRYSFILIREFQSLSNYPIFIKQFICPPAVFIQECNLIQTDLNWQKSHLINLADMQSVSS